MTFNGNKALPSQFFFCHPLWGLTHIPERSLLQLTKSLSFYPHCLCFPPVWTHPRWDERQAHISQTEAFHFWLCHTGGGTSPTSQLLACTGASFADISPSAKANQAPLSHSHPESCLHNQSKAPQPVPALCTCQAGWWGGEGPGGTHLLRFALLGKSLLSFTSQARGLGRHRNDSSSICRSKMHLPLLMQKGTPSFCL